MKCASHFFARWLKSETGVRFKFLLWDYPVVMPETAEPEILTSMTLRLSPSIKERLYLWVCFVQKRRIKVRPDDLSERHGTMLVLPRTKDLLTWERLPDLLYLFWSTTQCGGVTSRNFVWRESMPYIRRPARWLYQCRQWWWELVCGFYCDSSGKGENKTRVDSDNGKVYHRHQEIKNGQGGPAQLKPWRMVCTLLRACVTPGPVCVMCLHVYDGFSWALRITYKPGGPFLIIFFAPHGEERVGDVGLNVTFCQWLGSSMQ